MIKIGQIAHRVAFSVGRRQLSREVNSQVLFQPKNDWEAKRLLLQSNYLPFTTIDKLYKSTNTKKENLDEKPIIIQKDRKYYSPEEDQKLLEYVAEHGKTQSSLKGIAKILDRSISSVDNRCRKLLSGNEFKTYSNLKRKNIC